MTIEAYLLLIAGTLIAGVIIFYLLKQIGEMRSKLALGEKTSQFLSERLSRIADLERYNKELLNKITEAKQTEAREATDAPIQNAHIADLLDLTDASSTLEAITRAVAQVMQADLCLFIKPPDQKNLTRIASVYDLSRKENLDSLTFNRNLIPMLANAVEGGRPLRLASNDTGENFKGLSDLLGLEEPGALLIVPLLTPDNKPLGSILLLSPYTNRIWSASDQSFLENIAHYLSLTLQMNLREQGWERTNLVAQDRIALLEHRNHAMLDQRDSMLEDIERLKQERDSLRAGEGTKNTDPRQVEGELRLTLDEVARLQNQLAEANMRLVEMEKGGAFANHSGQAEVVASISQELRQPVSSITGYADLLLGESVGILGALQRKFMERIKGSTERIRGLVEDLIQITTPEDIKVEPVDLNSIIDNAMLHASSQIHEKNITMHVDVPLAGLTTPAQHIPWMQDATKTAQHLTRLTLESSAQAALITRNNSLWAYAGQLSQNAANELAVIVTRHWDGQKGSDLLRFVRSEATDAEHMLYATRLVDDVVLALVFDAETPFSAIRSRTGDLVDSLSLSEAGVMEMPPVLNQNTSPHEAQILNQDEGRRKNSSPISILADREALQQILIHLLRNAVSASPMEGTVQIKVSARTVHGEVFGLIQVIDTGAGIPAEDLPNVFTQLNRPDTPIIQGVGDSPIGLSIAKSLADAQNGRLWVDTEIGIGSTFNLMLPTHR